MAHPKGLTYKAVTDTLLNSDSEEDFGSDNNNELSESEGEYEYQSDQGAEGKLPMNSVAAAAVRKKNKGWKNGSEPFVFIS
jgi:hypothetical protein